MEQRKYILLILILGTASALSPFSIDMYLPAFPAIARGLNTSIAQVQISLTSFFIGISAGQLLYGPLIDRFGRKLPLYAGLVLYILASVGCAVTHLAHILIAMRLIQALGSCAGSVAARALVKDLFPTDQIARVFSLLMLVIAVSPLVAPTVGGYVSAVYGWHAVFIILGVIGVLILAACLLWLPGGSVADSSVSLQPGQVMETYYHVFKNPQFQKYALTGSLAGAALYAYLAGSPDVFIVLYRVSQEQYGWIFAIVAAGLIGSSQVNSILLTSYTSEKIILKAMFVQSLIGLTMFSLTFTGLMTEYLLIASIFMFLCCQGFIFPNTSALSLGPFEHQAGSASALMGTLQMGLGALSSFVVSFMYNGTALPMAGVMAACSFSAYLVLRLGSRNTRPLLPKESMQSAG